MTPAWRRAVRGLLKGTTPEERARLELLATARCFDLSPLSELLAATSQEMVVGAEEVDQADDYATFTLDIGERAMLPAPVCWLEWGGDSVLIDGSLAFAEERPGPEHPGEHAMLMAWRGTDSGLVGTLRLLDGVATVWRQKDGSDHVVDHNEQGLSLAFGALAALAAINSPAAERQTVAGHAGVQRDVRRATKVEPAIKFTMVTIGARAGRAEGGGDAHPKAYHFCRAHLRTRLGQQERVRAHWRGDPAFGWRLPSYKAKP